MNYRDLFVGLDVQVPLLDGRQVTYVNLDNAASTPSLRHVADCVQNFLGYYSSVHRGMGFKSQVSTHAYEQARLATLQFVGADPRDHICIFGKNATEAINRLSRRFPFTDDKNIILVSMMEHHSNDLPWRAVGRVVHVHLTPDGCLDEEDFDKKLARHAGRIAMVAISGASNVTGYVNPIHRLAEKAHKAGAQIMIDCAQLAPHRQIRMLPLDDPAHLDYVAISAHKMYAPFGTGALIGRRDLFEQGAPDLRGGGEVEIVTVDDVVWSEPPERDEAGSPNTVGAVALGAAIAQLEAIGMQAVANHETELTRYALEQLARVPNLRMFGCPDPEKTANRLGVIPVVVEGMSHYLVAAILGYEYGIGVRNGCFCAHPYLLNLLGVSEDRAGWVRSSILSHDRREVPGLVRISFGLYNEKEDVDVLVNALLDIQKGKYKGKYSQDVRSGAFQPEGWDIRFEDYFRFSVSQ